MSRARAWLRAAGDQAIAGELERVYAETAAAISERGPACWASGRCCKFERTGHLLYVTGLEAAYTVVRLVRPLTPVQIEGAGPPERGGTGGCPLQDGNLCGVHSIRPLGCRVYFCDRSAQEWQRELYERQLGAVRGLHDRHGVEYQYSEWRGLLAELVACK